MSIGREEVLHVARLAELAVAEAELPQLAAQLAAIVAYVEQLAELPVSGPAEGRTAGPRAVSLRDDVVRPDPLARGVGEMAPEFRDGFFLVPLRGTLEHDE